MGESLADKYVSNEQHYKNSYNAAKYITILSATVALVAALVFTAFYINCQMATAKFIATHKIALIASSSGLAAPWLIALIAIVANKCFFNLKKKKQFKDLCGNGDELAEALNNKSFISAICEKPKVLEAFMQALCEDMNTTAKALDNKNLKEVLLEKGEYLDWDKILPNKEIDPTKYINILAVINLHLPIGKWRFKSFKEQINSEEYKNALQYAVRSDLSLPNKKSHLMINENLKENWEQMAENLKENWGENPKKVWEDCLNNIHRDKRQGLFETIYNQKNKTLSYNNSTNFENSFYQSCGFKITNEIKKKIAMAGIDQGIFVSWSANLPPEGFNTFTQEISLYNKYVYYSYSEEQKKVLLNIAFNNKGNIEKIKNQEFTLDGEDIVVTVELADYEKEEVQ